MGRGCRGQALPRWSRVAAAHQDPPCSATGRCGRMPSSHHRRSGDIKRGHLQEPRWDVAWLGQTQPGGTFLALPSSPSPAYPRRKEMGQAKKWPQGHCHCWVPRHGLALAHGHSGSPRRGTWWRHPQLESWRKGEVGFPPLIPPRWRKGPAPNLQILLAPSPGRGWKVVDNKTNKKNVGHVIDC